MKVYGWYVVITAPLLLVAALVGFVIGLAIYVGWELNNLMARLRRNDRDDES